jgi:hypothetical protein
MKPLYRKSILFGTLGVLLLAVVRVLMPHTTEIRIDCGDLRYTIIGIPYHFERMDEPARTTLLLIASHGGIHPRWIPIMPRVVSLNIVAESRDRYVFAAVWARTDSRLGELLLKDISGALEAAAGTRPATTDADRILREVAPELLVPADWTNDEEIKVYCEKRGYTRPEWLTTKPKGQNSAEVNQTQ